MTVDVVRASNAQRPRSGSIRLRGVTKQYVSQIGDSVTAVSTMDADIESSSFVSIVGPSGCGKTTILRMIAGLVEATAGTLTVGEDLVAGPNREIAFVFQRPVLLPWKTVLQNVLLPAKIMKLADKSLAERVDVLLQMAGLAEFAGKYPWELSGGMQQRASLVRALVHDPTVLLMDEPFGALDALTRDQMNEELLRIWQERPKTVVFVTHSISEAVFLSDRVLVMSARPGRVVADIEIDLPRPRDSSVRSNSQFDKYNHEIRAKLGL